MPIYSSSDGGVSLHYEVYGSGNTPVLFIMGLLTDWDGWRHQVNYFATHPNFRICVFDNRGVGKSSTPSPFLHPYTSSSMSVDALHLVNSLQWNAFHLVGVSLGGMISQELALLTPQRILSLTLISTHCGNHFSLGFTGQMHLANGLFFSKNDQDAMRRIFPMLYGKNSRANPELYQRLMSFHEDRMRRRVKPQGAAVLGHISAASGHYLSVQHLLQLRYSLFPILVITGEEDNLILPSNSQFLAKILSAKLVVVKGSSHGTINECPSTVNREVSQFMLAAIQRRVALRNKAPAAVTSFADSIFSMRREERYSVQWNALSYCCTHRGTCHATAFRYFFNAFLSGFLIRFIFAEYGNNSSSSVLPSSSPPSRLERAFRTGLLLASLRGAYRAIRCIVNVFRARHFVSSLADSYKTKSTSPAQFSLVSCDCVPPSPAALTARKLSGTEPQTAVNAQSEVNLDDEIVFQREEEEKAKIPTNFAFPFPFQSMLFLGAIFYIYYKRLHNVSF